RWPPITIERRMSALVRNAAFTRQPGPANIRCSHPPEGGVPAMLGTPRSRGRMISKGCRELEVSAA
ncbi:MAG: hypothetical protein ABSA45_11895, partial [Verrucomicrobiota bacterium]